MGNETTKPTKTENVLREEHQAVTEKRLRQTEVRQHRDRQAGEMTFEASSGLNKKPTFQTSKSGTCEELGSEWRRLEKKGTWDESVMSHTKRKPT